MKKLVSIMSLVCMAGISARAQFTNTTGMSTYTELSSPTSLNGITIWNENSSFPIYLPFSFSIYGQTYTALNVMAGGGLDFPGAGVKDLRVFWVVFSGGYYLKDRGTSSSLSSVSYIITGGTGNHVLKVQWKNAGFKQVGPTVDPSDFVNFQVWLFENDNHFEIHFGPSSTGANTYGSTGSSPGTELIFRFDGCDNLFAITGPCDLPSYSMINGCSPFGSYIVGTPSSGIVYNIRPTTSSVQSPVAGEAATTLYPNPAHDQLTIENGVGSYSKMVVTNSVGQVVATQDVRPGSIDLDISRFSPGLYFVELSGMEGVLSRRFVKE